MQTQTYKPLIVNNLRNQHLQFKDKFDLKVFFAKRK